MKQKQRVPEPLYALNMSAIKAKLRAEMDDIVSKLKTLRPDYDHQDKDICECLECAIAGRPLPGEENYRQSLAYDFTDLSSSFDRVTVAWKEMSRIFEKQLTITPANSSRRKKKSWREEVLAP